MKKAIISIFAGILFLPLLLTFIAKASSFPCDVNLLGYTDTVSKPELTKSSFLDGTFQKAYSSWYESNLKPRGVFIKTHATIQYNCFHLGRNPIGYNNDILGPSYIDRELCINGAPDFSKAENWEKMVSYVEKLEVLQEKLDQFGKYLYVYVAPSKADFHYDNIPQKYKNISDPNAINAADAFAQLMGETDIPHLICSTMKDTLKYPAFYTTGIHWSRTFEQEASARIINDLCKVTGKEYRNILLEEVQESTVPYWRDADVYNLLNVWNKSSGHYFQYNTSREKKEEYDKIRLLVQGDSFAEGLMKDILDIYPFENVFRMDRKNYLIDRAWKRITIDSWENFDISTYLDNVDVIILEATEPEISSYSYGFVDYLIDYLDTYEPGDGGKTYSMELNTDSGEAWQSDSLNGFHGLESGFAWVKNYSEIILENPEIVNAGLELEITVPPYVFIENQDADVIDVYVNGKKLFSQDFFQAWSGSIYISPETLQTVMDDDRYDIELYCSKFFVPKEVIAGSQDGRYLAIQIRYVGSVR